MDRLIISDTGFPLDLKALRFMRNFYEGFIETLGTALGDNVIINGVEDDGTNITSGWIIHDGEIMPFQGGASQSHYRIVETIEQVFYDNNAATTAASNLPAFKVRIALPSASSSDFPISGLKRIKQQDELLSIVRTGRVQVYRTSPTQLATTFFDDVTNAFVTPANVYGNGDIRVQFEPLSSFSLFSNYAVEINSVEGIGQNRVYPLNVIRKSAGEFVVRVNNAAIDFDYVNFNFKIIHSAI